MIFSLLLGCATPIWGVWMFTVELSPTTGDECVTGAPQHNFAGAHAPASSTEEDTTWVTESTEEFSPYVFFGRIEEVGQGSALVIGNTVLPGERNDDGSSTYVWTTSDSGTLTNTHASGYSYANEYEDSTTVKVDGAFNNDTFTGNYSTTSASFDKWSESDTWSLEAAAYVGDTGQIPASTYLTLTNEFGVEVAASNGRSSYDCDSAGCTLSIDSSCLYEYAISGQSTNFEADDRWVRDATIPAGGS